MRRKKMSVVASKSTAWFTVREGSTFASSSTEFMSTHPQGPCASHQGTKYITSVSCSENTTLRTLLVFPSRYFNTFGLEVGQKTVLGFYGHGKVILNPQDSTMWGEKVACTKALLSGQWQHGMGKILMLFPISKGTTKATALREECLALGFSLNVLLWRGILERCSTWT